MVAFHNPRSGETAMAGNIIDLIKSELGGSFNEAAANVTGLNTDQTQRTVGAAIPAILASILGSATSPGGSSALASTLQSQDPGLLSNLSSATMAGNRQSLIGQGVNMLTSLLGEGKLSTLVNALSSFGGMKPGGAQSLLGMLMPVVMGVLGQRQRAGNLGADGLIQMLESQRGSIASALPPSLATSLDSAGLLRGLGDTARTAAGAATGAATAAGRTAAAEAAAAADAARQTAARSGGWAKYAIGVLILALIIWGVSRFVGREPAQQAAQNAVNTATQTATTAGSMTVGDVDLGKEFTGISDGITQTMANVKDAASANDALPKLTDLTGKLDNLTSLKSKLPDASKSAFTDMVKKTSTSLQAAMDRVNALPGVSDVIKPALDGLKAKLDALAA
jgi:hypothetical protein